VSFIIRRNSGWVFDHEYDTVYEVKYFDEHFDVYGPQEGRRYTVGPSDAPSGLLLPYRITDASEGIVVWAVDKRIVNEDLQVRGQDTDARANPTNLEAWDIGDGKTPVVLGVVDHREGDLKAHREMVLCAVVAPKDQPLAVGIWPMCEAPVTTPLVKQASIQIWGYDKVLSSITTRHTGRRAIFELTGESGGKLLTLTLPRGGESMSPMIPVLSYTLKRATPYSPRALHRTLITRSGRGEQLRGGGAGVELEVDPHGLTMTGTGPASALCQMLQRLGLVDGSGQLACPPLFTAWTEELSAEVGGPSLVVTAAESA
jgi:hypothetical protein